MITSNNAPARQYLNFSIAGALRMMFLNLLVIPIPTLQHPVSNLCNLCEILTTEKKHFLIWHQIFGTDSLLVSLKATENLSTYKHKIKKHFLNRMKNDESDIHTYIYIYIYIYIFYVNARHFLKVIQSQYIYIYIYIYIYMHTYIYTNITTWF